MALILGDGQIKYFSKYVQDSRIQMYYSSGCRVEELVHLPAMKEAIPAASVIVVHCGINNLPGDSAEALLEKFQRLYDDIKEVNPAANIVFSSMLPMTTGEIETNLDVRTLETINATSRTANKTLFDVSGLARYPDIEFLNNDHDFKQRDMFCRDGQGLSFKGTELLVSRIENVIQRMLSRAVPLDSAADYSESAPAAESRVHLTGGGSISSEDNVQDDFTSVIYSNCDVKLKHSEAAEMLDNPDISKLSNFPPFKPKGGSVYLLTDGQKIQNKDDWRADGYTWAEQKVRRISS